MTLTVCSLFTGYGGLEFGIEQACNQPLDTKYICDIEPGPQTLEQVRFPNATQLGDITQVDFTSLEPCDIVSGGSPCTDISVAGKQQGMFSGTRSGLWSFQADAIAAMQPKYVVWENVAAAIQAPAATTFTDPNIKTPMRALGRVLLDLHNLGYMAAWVTLTASQAGAAHHRARIFLLASKTREVFSATPQAYADSEHDMWRAADPSLFDPWYTSVLPASGIMADGVLYQHNFTIPTIPNMAVLPTPTSSDSTIGATNSSAWKPGYTNLKGLTRALRLLCARVDPSGVEVENLPVLRLLPTPVARDTKGVGRQSGIPSTILQSDGLNYYKTALDRWSHVIGRPYPKPLLVSDRAGQALEYADTTLTNPAWLRKHAFTRRFTTVCDPERERVWQLGLPHISDEDICPAAYRGVQVPFDQVPPVAVTDLWRQRIANLPVTLGKTNPQFVEWLMGLPEGWVTDKAVAYKRPYFAQIRMLGNGVVPQQAGLALQTLTKGGLA